MRRRRGCPARVGEVGTPGLALESAREGEVSMRRFVLAALALAAVVPSSGIAQSTRVDVSLGDVSINKVPQLVAADQGLYAKYGLDVHQTISAGAARAAAASGVVVPEAYVNRDASLAAPIEVGGGSPMIYGFVANARGAARVIVLTQEAMAVDHIIAKPGIAGILRGRFGDALAAPSASPQEFYDSSL